jgi:nitrogen fixation/metabolism regulation signal transduction histidine kinase
MRNFRVQVLTRVIMISVTVVAAIALFEYSGSHVSAALLGGLALFQVAALVRYVDKTNRDLDRFLRSVRYSDFSQTFSSLGRGKSFELLGRAFAEVMDDFRAARAETETQHRFLHTVMQHVGTGLLTFDADGDVGLINNAAKRLFRVQNLKNIRALDEFSPELVDALLLIESGSRSIVKVVVEDQILELILYGTAFRISEKTYKLVSVQDIQTELEERELEAWQKLTRVLTHEIMNSITPIASLAGTANALLDGGEGEERKTVPDDALEDVRGAVQTIERRSQGLLRFVQAYRSLTRIPRSNLQIFPVRDLFEGVLGLYRSEMERGGIVSETVPEPYSLDLTADPELIEQVLINLVKNAIQALAETKDARLILRAFIDARGKTVIQVSDNGPGIEPEALDKIFIPFFTTKSQGSGIGLSLSRQIMRQHGGTLTIKSVPGEMTVCTLRF